jgi:group II intron reverse transcriptase/maturase
VLGPKSGRTASPPKPAKILSKEALREAWKASRDSSANSGRPGIDGITAQAFASNLDFNLAGLAKRLKSGSYGPTSLKTAFIPKENSSKERMICIPSVADRLVQRAIVRYLVINQKLPIYNSSSFGFIEGLGTTKAIRRALDLRRQHEWCLKTDIESFFDSIQRPYLKDRVTKALGNHSLTPIICRIIDCEIQLNSRNKDKVRNQGIRIGVGIRQGMPLSPVLANLVLSRFDKEIERSKIQMVRYADDLLLFFHDKNSALAGHNLIKEILKKIELTIPEIGNNSKTALIGPYEPISFLGREIAYLNTKGGYVAGIGVRQIEKIKAQIKNDYGLKKRFQAGSSLQDTVVELWQSIAAYLGVYKDVHNFNFFEKEMRSIARATISQIFVDIFGKDALSKLTSDQKNFLGIGQLVLPAGINDIET